MTSPTDSTDRYRAEFEVPVTKKRCCIFDCLKKKPKHERQFTKAEVDYTIMIRSQKVIREIKR
jgi:hypothetical protein